MSCCGACGGQDTEKTQGQDEQSESEQKPVSEQNEARSSVQTWTADN
jgi:hypothetical protein